VFLEYLWLPTLKSSIRGKKFLSPRVARWYMYFQTKNSQFAKNLEGFGMERVYTFYGHLEYI
jgi:hypothetical protein